MTSRSLPLALALLALLSLAAACASSATQPPDTASVSPLATPGATFLPRDHTPKPDLGIVQGIVTLDGRPVVGETLYLAAVIAGQGQFEVAALDPVRDPRAETDSTGYFVFLDVAPGRYGLGINSPSGPVLIQQDGMEIIADVQAGHIVDLGTIPIVPFGQ